MSNENENEKIHEQRVSELLGYLQGLCDSDATEALRVLFTTMASLFGATVKLEVAEQAAEEIAQGLKSEMLRLVAERDDAEERP